MRTILERVKELCAEKELSLNRVLREAGVSGGYFSNLGKRERARSGKDSPRSGPNAAKLEAAANVLGANVEWLLKETGPKWRLTPPPYGDSASYREAEPIAMKRAALTEELPDMAFRLARGMPAARAKPVYDVTDVLAIVAYYWRTATEAEVKRVEGEMRAEQERAENVVTTLRPPSTNPGAPKSSAAAKLKKSKGR